jgi:flagellin-like hook-associated protein FlgL
VTVRTPSRVNFTSSAKLRAEAKKLTGQGEASRGQIDVTPEDFVLVPFVMNEFDSAKLEGDGVLLFSKQIDGTVVSVSIQVGKKQKVLSIRRMNGRVPRASSALGKTSETAPAKKIMAQAEALRQARDNVSTRRSRLGIWIRRSDSSRLRRVRTSICRVLSIKWIIGRRQFHRDVPRRA